MLKVLLLQGANGNYLGKREPSVYGSTTVDQLDTLLHQHAHEKGYSLEIPYTNIEGEAIKQRANEHQRVTRLASHSMGLVSDYRSNMCWRR
jgi:3-dehydroquinate dehydratase